MPDEKLTDDLEKVDSILDEVGDKNENITGPEVNISDSSDRSKRTAFIILTFVVVVITLLLGFYLYKKTIKPKVSSGEKTQIQEELTKLDKFKSNEEFKTFIAKAEEKTQTGSSYLGLGSRNTAISELSLPSAGGSFGSLDKSTTVSRYSETNVQVAGIDEPDILKTDGKSIYFSKENQYYGEPIMMRETTSLLEDSFPSTEMKTGVNLTKIIKAFPPSDLSITSDIQENGNLLLSKSNLIIFPLGKIVSYDISDQVNPKKAWEFKLESNNQILASRLIKDKLYVIFKTVVNSFTPCPIKVMSSSGSNMEVLCTDIYRPAVSIPSDSTITAVSIDIASGKTDKKVSFMGSSGNSVVYMSNDNLYVTYSYYEDIAEFMYKFLNEEAKDLVSAEVLNRINEIKGYNLSSETKLMELSRITEQYIQSLSDDERLKFNNEMENRGNSYIKKHKRELEKTGIAKVGLSNLEISNVGAVPGILLNQFALDEFNSNLRVATTISQSFLGGSGESANDLYVLGKDMKVIGAVTDMGLSERIYSVRFVEDKAYIVTFRQTDPFYVLDLSNPESPSLKGELKIPGFSSYLHPIGKNKILGIGEESSKVKISLFDVSDPSNPKELSKYSLDEYWSEIENTHHAFTIDYDNKVFFIPGGKGGYIFSYEKDILSLVKAVADVSVKRALYINNYFYIIGDTGINILNESDWESVNTLEY